ncbi:hypothetical protein EDB86DRAFT_3065710 [Lactarius hatsudake]|nr:hypothetical protein EDB86DRAFT_3065710 [Lactarius hatsudake]
MDALCPKCRRRFADSRGVLVHLNHKYSSCHNFLDDYDALSAYTEDLQRRTVQQYHPRSLFIYGQKPNTLERTAGDSFAHRWATNLYYPFQSRKEWGLARFLARSSLSQSEIDEFLKLEWVKLQKPTFTSAHALRSLIESLPDPPRWYCEEMIIEGYESEKITFYWCDALDVIEYIFGNPIFAPYMQYDPQRVWTDISKAERVYSEYMTGDFAWQSQDRLPTGATQLAVVGASDKTCVTAMTGGLEMYPAYLTLANIVSEVRMKASSHAWMCFSFPRIDARKRERQATTATRIGHVDKAKELSLSGVHLPFWRDWYMADPYHFLVPEILHTCHKFFYDHPLQWCINAIGALEFDSRFKSLHPRVGFHHFGNGVMHVKQMTGREHRDIQRSIVAVIAGTVPPHFLCAIRALVDFIYQVQSPLLTESAIVKFVDALQKFHDEKEAIIAAGVRMGSKGPIDHFNIPKLEILHHFACSTKMMGVPIQWTADVTECLHITEVKHPFRATNHRNFEEQCTRSLINTRILDRLERVHLFDLICSFLVNGNLKHENPAAAEAVLAVEQDPDTAHSLTATAHEMIVTSRRPTANYFLNGFVSSDSLTAFHLNKTPDVTSISISDTANLYALQDFWPALGDFTRGLSHQQCRGRRISRGHPDVGFDHIRVWFRFKIQLRSTHDRHVVVPAQTVQALPLSKKHPQGLCDAVLIHTHGDAGDESFQVFANSNVSIETQVVQVRMVFQPISREQPSESIHPLLCYVQKFSFTGRRAEDGTRLKEQNVGMYLVRRQFRAPTVGSGERMRMGDITPIIDIARAVDIVPVYGARMDP